MFFQKIIRFIFCARFADSDSLRYAAGAFLKNHVSLDFGFYMLHKSFRRLKISGLPETNIVKFAVAADRLEPPLKPPKIFAVHHISRFAPVEVVNTLFEPCITFAVFRVDVNVAFVHIG